MGLSDRRCSDGAMRAGRSRSLSTRLDRALDRAAIAAAMWRLARLRRGALFGREAHGPTRNSPASGTRISSALRARSTARRLRRIRATW
jgi:hypothetical protein